MSGQINGASSTSADSHHTSIPPRLCATADKPSLEAFKKLTTNSSPAHYPLAASILKNVPVYNLPDYFSLSPAQLSAFQDEWYHILLSGPGVFVTKGLYKDPSLLERVNTVFSSIIVKEKASSGSKGDHFAGTGQNDRIWNSFSKHGLEDPQSYFEYYSNPWLPLISAAWLGPHHRLTAQVNIVKPGAKPQISHRDYHLGFQTAESCAQFPKALQIASQHLTLQGAVAHSDMPIESGPTRLLPFSQKFEDGYMAYRLQEFSDFFLENYVSLPLELGDGLFFNPALFHAAGQNDSSDVLRSANLLQISAAFGKPMETIETFPLIERTWDLLVERYSKEGLSEGVRTFIGNVAEGYPFPTNLDRRVPETAGMAPESEQELLVRGLKKGFDKIQLLKELRKLKEDEKA
ncbi:phytanoyl-CoA dioxygenase-like protein [Aaosphaeria arxii CBS 175.79]|uniref:Phytanoyl-CoA dioxygenase-like protein n=1 Tax=Aaosphaeria arxii CBS 175.79 TaxID=1450172 RepID=A0A6A5Y9D2_9PLEO|nr:phytanoyl-CoA dioxygenase-like protein [Aaosphaeria arxii CBS 175.79]KAF2021204.1 phytanoyl-CoA dioxygenase-like protein [Aaosphaeria arxii CBS 175.79]